jgi:hypothetical protein
MSKGIARTADPSVQPVASGFARRVFLIGAAVSAAIALLVATLPGSTDSASAETIAVWQLPTQRCCAE